MPRYYFHMLDSHTGTLVKDAAGISLPDASVAKREAVALARDIVQHWLHLSAWQLIVMDPQANVVVTVSLSKVKPRLISALRRWVRRVALYEPKLRPQIFTCLLMAVVLALIIQSQIVRNLSRQKIEVARTIRTCQTC